MSVRGDHVPSSPASIRTRALAWGIASAIVLFVLSAGGLLIANGRLTAGRVANGLFSTAIPAIILAVLGALVAGRRPRNAVGWLMLATAAVQAASVFAVQAAIRLLQAGASPDGWVRWLAWGGVLFGTTVPITLVILTFLVFPDGTLPYRISRWAAGSAAIVIGALTVLVALDPARIDLAPGTPRPTNPTGVTAIRGFNAGTTAVGLLWFALLVPLVLAISATVVRLRRSRGLERRQLSWVAYVGGVSLALLFIAVLLATGAQAAGVSSATGLAVVGDLAFTVAEIGLGLAVPAVMAITILRQRLYDIDRVVNRTLVYGALTAVLAAVYAGLVLSLGSISRSLGGSGSGRGVVVAASTLAVAALVRPLRRRVQSAIDRRFYRRRYDAARTIGSFASRLRTESDLEVVRRDLVFVVGETMQPASVSVWLDVRTGPSAPPEAAGEP
jgi:hypothetical protein